MDAEAGEFQDWEVLQSDSSSQSSDPVHHSNDFEEIDTHSGGMIQTDYFSMDPLQSRYGTTVSGADLNEMGSENSDNPSWIDPNSETRYPRKEAGEFWSDSGSDRSDDRKFVEFEGNNEMGSYANEKLQVGFDGNVKLQVGFQGIEEISGANEKKLDKIEKLWTVSGGIELDSVKIGDLEVESESISKENANLEALEEEKREKEPIGGESVGESLEIEAKKVEQEEEKKKSVVWWKLPIEFLRYCVFRASPVWTFSVAAAVMGFVILGRRLYKMKRKNRGLELKVTMDDKKISQFMSRAARLNEAFSVVKRVPVIRPSLPAVGVTPWPVMSLR